MTQDTSVAFITEPSPGRRRTPTTTEVRLQAARIIALAVEVNMPVPHLADALSACGLRLEGDQLAVPARVSALLGTNGRRRK